LKISKKEGDYEEREERSEIVMFENEINIMNCF
jgi:hypothetical protein